MTEKLLQLRKRIKAKKPDFVSQDTHKKIRIRKRWRKPRGWQSKIRLKKRGYRKMVMTGYGSPKLVYGVHSTGLKPIRISSESELKNIDAGTQGIILAKIGAKKKLDIIKKAKELGLKILNIDADAYIKSIEEKNAEKKEAKKKTEEEKKKQVEKKPKEKDKSKEELTEDEKKELEKKKAEKILTKKS